MQKCFEALLILGFVGLSACVAEIPTPSLELPVSQKASIEQATQAQNSADRMKADVTYLASDLRQGREAGSEAYEEAARYVAGRFGALGLEPGADGQWYQSVPLRSVTRDLASGVLAVETADGTTQNLTHIEDFIIGRSVAEPSFDVRAPAVFVGYGISAKEEGHDDYAAIDVITSMAA